MKRAADVDAIALVAFVWVLGLAVTGCIVAVALNWGDL